jgi:hypothetical protein
MFGEILSELKKYTDTSEFKKIKTHHDKWKITRSTCRSVYGGDSVACLLKLYQQENNYLENMLLQFKTHEYLHEKGKCISLVKKHLVVTFMENEVTCVEYFGYDDHERLKLFFNKSPLAQGQIKDRVDYSYIDLNETSVLGNCKHYDYAPVYEQNIVFINQNVVSFYTEGDGSAWERYRLHFTHGITYDRHTAQPVTWEEMFGKNNSITQYALEQVRKITRDSEYFKKNPYRFKEVESFFITKNGLKINFSYGEVGFNWENEFVEFEITHKVLKKYMDQDKFEYYFKESKSVYLSSKCKKEK